MSRVYFQSPSGDAALLGSERAWAGSLVSDLSTGLVSPFVGDQVDRMLELVPAGHYLHAVDRNTPGWLPRWLSSFHTAWRVDLRLHWDGHDFDAWTVGLNTALVVGNDPIRFLARLHAQCEIHTWVDGPHRAWLAGIIAAGRELGFYRPDAGWEAVVELLRSRDDEPVVLSYSVTDTFPNSGSSDYMPPWPEGVPEQWDALTDAQKQERRDASEAWYGLDYDERWASGMRWLREQSGLQMTPEDWPTFRFGHELSAFDLIAPDRDARLARAFADG